MEESEPADILFEQAVRVDFISQNLRGKNPLLFPNSSGIHCSSPYYLCNNSVSVSYDELAQIHLVNFMASRALNWFLKLLCQLHHDERYMVFVYVLNVLVSVCHML